MARQKTDSFDHVEFTSSEDVLNFAKDMAHAGQALQLELHEIAAELEVTLAKSTGRFMERVTAKRKARKTANQVRKAADAGKLIASQGVKLAKMYRKEYAILIDPPKGRSNFNWEL